MVTNLVNNAETGLVIDKEPVYVDESLIWRTGMGIKPEEEAGITPPKPPAGIVPLVVDIETTGANPWDSRIICIGYKDPADTLSDPVVILDEDEEKILIEFLSSYVSGGYNQLIMFNGAFDYRFIFARCLYYRIACKEFVDSYIYDIMQVVQQVKQTFVYSLNKSGNLENWIQFLLGVGKTMTLEELLAAWELKDYPKIIEYNMNDVQVEFILYALIELVKQGPFIGKSFAVEEGAAGGLSRPSTAPATAALETGEKTTWKAICPVCLATADVPTTQAAYYCKICNTLIRR
jgi:hypothetical protein